MEFVASPGPATRAAAVAGTGSQGDDPSHRSVGVSVVGIGVATQCLSEVGVDRFVALNGAQPSALERRLVDRDRQIRHGSSVALIPWSTNGRI